MNKLKTKFGKYFQFKNTTNGTDYFLRGLALILFIIPIGIFVGVGVALVTTNTVLAGLLVGTAGFGIRRNDLVFTGSNLQKNQCIFS